MISDKYRKMRYKNPPVSFNLNSVVDAESIAYDGDRNIFDISSITSATITANKIKNKYKKIAGKK